MLRPQWTIVPVQGRTDTESVQRKGSSRASRHPDAMIFYASHIGEFSPQKCALRTVDILNRKRDLANCSADDTLPTLIANFFWLCGLPHMVLNTFEISSRRYRAMNTDTHMEYLIKSMDFAKLESECFDLCHTERNSKNAIILATSYLLRSTTCKSSSEREITVGYAQMLAQTYVAPYNDDRSANFMTKLEASIQKLKEMLPDWDTNSLQFKFRNLLQEIGLNPIQEGRVWRDAHDLLILLKPAFPENSELLLRQIVNYNNNPVMLENTETLLTAKLELLKYGFINPWELPDDATELAIHFLCIFKNHRYTATDFAPLFDVLPIECQRRVLDAFRELIEASPVHGKAYDDASLSDISRKEFAIYNYRKLTLHLLRDRVQDGSEITASELLTDAFEAIKFLVVYSHKYITDIEASEFCVGYFVSRFWRLYRQKNDKCILWTLQQLLNYLLEFANLPRSTFCYVEIMIHLELGHVSQVTKNLETLGNALFPTPYEKFIYDHFIGASYMNNCDIVSAIGRSSEVLSHQLDHVAIMENNYCSYVESGSVVEAFECMTQVLDLRNNITTAAESIRYAFLQFCRNSDLIATEKDFTFPDGFPIDLPADNRTYLPLLAIADEFQLGLLKTETYCQTLSEIIAVQSIMDLHFQVARMANLPGYQELVTQTVTLIDKHLTVLGTTDANPIHDHVFFYYRGHLFGNPVSLITKDIIRFLGDLAVIAAADNFTTPESLPSLDPLRKSLIRLDTYTEKLAELGVEGIDVVVEGLSTALMQLHYCIYLVFLIYRNLCSHDSPTEQVVEWFRTLITDLRVSYDFVHYSAAEFGECCLMLRSKIVSSPADDPISLGVINGVQNGLNAMFDLLETPSFAALKHVGLIVD